MSSGLRMHPFFEATAPASHASASTTTPALSICALMSFMNCESPMRCARSWLAHQAGHQGGAERAHLPLA